ncbi:MAG: hypothetical protein HYR91_05570 [Flavobacteriia bacterium]|nr:hypothetical protein [Flavobacteriia bacterium]
MKSLFLFSILLLTLSCATKKESISSDYPKEPELKAIIGDISTKSEPIKIDSVEIKGNKMIISVTYTGGCGNHIFELIGSPNIAKSMPPIRAIKLIHKSENDNCKSLITRKLHFDISELAYKKDNGSEIYLTLEGVKEKMSYLFE